MPSATDTTLRDAVVQGMGHDELHALAPLTMLDLPNEVYHRSPGLSHSGAKELRRSPYHYRARMSGAMASKGPTPAMFNGTLVHCALLEPDAFDARYIVGPDLHKSSNAWKAFCAECAAAGREPISQEQRDAAFAQANALRMRPAIADLLDRPGHAEVSAYWVDPITEVLCKCRPDWVAPYGWGNGAVLVDVKTTSSAAPDEFAKSIATFGYHTQCDWYCTGYELAGHVEVHGMVFAVVESDPPYATNVFMLSDEALALGRKQNTLARELYAACAATNTWPGYATGDSGVNVIDLPAWAYRSVE